HSQTVPMICPAVLANSATTRERRQTHCNIRYLWKATRYSLRYWPAQAVSRERGRVVLPRGRARPSRVFWVNLPEQRGAGRFWARYLLAEATAPYGPWADRPKAHALPERFTSLPQTASGPPPRNDAQALADTRFALQGHPQGECLLPAAGHGFP